MQAIVHDRYGPPEQALELREVDPPVAGDGEVLVGVHAAGVAIGDWLIVNGLPHIARPGYGLVRPKHRIAGLEAAGRVVAVGADVTRFQPGDAAFGWCDGALAEYVAVPADQLVDKPDTVSFEQVAATPISGLAALQTLRDTGQVTKGQSVAILGASGAAGTFAVQIAKALGAEVTGVCSTRNVDLVAFAGRRPRHRLHPPGHQRQRPALRRDHRHGRQPTAVRAAARTGAPGDVGDRGRLGRSVADGLRPHHQSDPRVAVRRQPAAAGVLLQADQRRSRRAAGLPRCEQRRTGHRPHLRARPPWRSATSRSAIPRARP